MTPNPLTLHFTSCRISERMSLVNLNSSASERAGLWWWAIHTSVYRYALFTREASASTRAWKPRDNFYPRAISKTKETPYFIFTTLNRGRVHLSWQKNAPFRESVQLLEKYTGNQPHWQPLCIQSFNFCSLLGDALIVDMERFQRAFQFS